MELSSRRRFTQRVLLWTSLAVGFVVLIAWATCVVVICVAGDPRPALLGNVAAASGTGESFRFAVLGDTQKGTTGLTRLLARLRDERLAFLLHTGDLVSNADPGHYLLARRTLAQAPLEIPMLVVPGNHDVKPDPSLFAQQIGPREFAFSHGRVHFISVDTALGNPPNPQDLERRLQTAGDATIVLFMHQPPFDASSDAFTVKRGYATVIELIRKYRVAYVLCGHVHRYRRIQDAGTTYIANGVGGDYDHWQLNQGVYATLVDVNGRELRDRVVELPPEHRLWDNVEHLALGHVAEAYRRRPVLSGAATILVLAFWIWTIVRLRFRSCA